VRVSRSAHIVRNASKNDREMMKHFLPRLIRRLRQKMRQIDASKILRRRVQMKRFHESISQLKMSYEQKFKRFHESISQLKMSYEQKFKRFHESISQLKMSYEQKFKRFHESISQLKMSYNT
jgi:hypothetical protein